jgi:hypothetical protein
MQAQAACPRWRTSIPAKAQVRRLFFIAMLLWYFSTKERYLSTNNKQLTRVYYEMALVTRLARLGPMV